MSPRVPGALGKESVVPGTRYVNVRSNKVVETRNEGPASFTIVTVTDDGYGPRRRVPSASFHKSYLTGNGQPHPAGYVPVRTLPGNHPAAMNTEIDRMELLEHLDDLSNAELADLIREQQRIVEEAKTLVDRAKAVAKKRRKDVGLELHGDTAMVFTSGKKFDAKTASRNLSQDQLLAISVPKPDATRAKRMFGEDSEEYKSCLKDNGFTLTVREATDEDRLKVLSEKSAEDTEIFDLDETITV